MNRIVFRCISLFYLLAILALPSQGAKPFIAGPVLNGASFEGHTPSPSTPSPSGAGLARGSIFVFIGTNLGPSELIRGNVPYPDQLPAEAGGTRITFRSLENDQVYTAPLIHSLHYQVSGIVPSPLPVGLAEVTVSYDGMESEPATVAIVEYSPGLFTVSQTGKGPAVVQNYESTTSQPLNTLTHPASPGQYLILWGTGLGPIEGPDNVASTAGNLRDDVSVLIGNVEIPAEYAGRSPEFPGVDQINVRIPDDGSVELSCYQDIGIKIGDSWFGLSASISISDKPGECEHPWGLSAEKLTELDAGGTVTFLEARLSEEFSIVKAARLDAYGVSQNRRQTLITGVISPSLITSIISPSRITGIISPWFISYGSCLPSMFLQPPLPPPGPSARFRGQPGETMLDLGDSVEFSGPGARGFSLPKPELDATAFGPVADLGEDVLVAGDWTLSAAGGAHLGAFSSGFSLNPLPELSLPTNIQPGGAIDVTWDGSAYQDGDRIVIRLRRNPDEFPQSGLRSLQCAVDATYGSVEVTAEQIAWLEAEPGSPLLWTASVESAPQEIEAEGLDYGHLTALVSIEVEAIAAE